MTTLIATRSLVASKDRKVANQATSNGKQATMSNTMGLASGIDYSCPGMTDVCSLICYAGKLQKLFPAVGANMLANWNAVKDASLIECFDMLNELVYAFDMESTKRNAEKIYRVHWDGDFFNAAYTEAWINIFILYPHIRFWAYTRNAVAAVAIHKAGVPNVSLYFSTDDANKVIGAMLNRTYGIRIAYLAKTFAESQAGVRNITGRTAAKCPEQTKQIKLIDTNGSACSVCRLCVDGKADIAFSISKK